MGIASFLDKYFSEIGIHVGMEIKAQSFCDNACRIVNQIINFLRRDI